MVLSSSSVPEGLAHPHVRFLRSCRPTLRRRCDVLAESCSRRGVGLTLKARCPLHLNVTAALLDTLSDIQQQLTRLYAEIDADTFRRRVEEIREAHTAPGSTSKEVEPSLAAGGGGDSSSALVSREIHRAGSGDGAESRAAIGGNTRDTKMSRYRHRDIMEYYDICSLTWPSSGVDLAERVHSKTAQGYSDEADGVGDRGYGSGAVVPSPHAPVPVCHQFSAPLPLESRVSFTILNLTGQRTRYFQPRVGDETRHLRYLRVRHGRKVVICTLLPLASLRITYKSLHLSWLSVPFAAFIVSMC